MINILYEIRKATGCKSLRLNYWEINQATTKCQTDFWTKLAKKVYNRKSEHCYKIIYIQISLATKFRIKTDSSEFLDQINTKRVFSN